MKRGQTLVLFCLTLLLLSLLVLMTLGIGTRIHERQEQQTVADAAAYSEAVAEARAYNALAVENRVLIAQMASIAAAQSMLSWLGFYHGTLNQARDVLFAMGGGCGDISAAVVKVMAEDSRLIELWEPAGGGYIGIQGDDIRAGAYIRSDLYLTAIDIAQDQKATWNKMRGEVGDASTRIANRARQGSPWRSDPGELESLPQLTTADKLDQGVVKLQKQPVDMVRATMAAAGVDPFVTSREGNLRTQDVGAAAYVQARIANLVAPLQIVVNDYGTSYFGDDGPQMTSGPGELQGYDGQALNLVDWKKWTRVKSEENLTYWGAWAQDYGTFHFVPPPGCGATDPTENSFGYIVTTGPSDNRDNHMWRRGNQGFGDYRERNDELGHVKPSIWPQRRHTFLVTPPDANPPSIWPVFTDFDADTLNRGDDSKIHAFGQPKTLSSLRREYENRGKGDPWELRPKFSFSATGPGQRLDLRGQRAGLRHAMAVAAGFVYYHRGTPAAVGASGLKPADHSREPPNLLNPFWRATLVASDIDEAYPNRGDSVIKQMTDDGEPAAATTLRLLRAKGFEAMP